MNSEMQARLGDLVKNLQVLGDEVPTMQFLRTRGKMDIAQLKLLSHQQMPIQMLTRGVGQGHQFMPTSTPVVSPMPDLGLAMGDGSANKRGAGKVGFIEATSARVQSVVEAEVARAGEIPPPR